MSSSSVKHSKASAPEPSRSHDLALVVAALIGQNVASFGLTNYLINTGYTLVLLVVSIAGAFLAQYRRRQGKARELLIPGATGLIVLFATTQIVIARFGRVLPLDLVLTSADVSLVMALTLTASVATCLWVTDSAILFSCVWSMAMVGLSATFNFNVTTIVGFLVFLLTTLFIMIHHQTLSHLGTRGRAGAGSTALLKLQLRTAAFLWLAVTGLGFLVAIPLQMIGRNMSLANILERLKVTPERKPNNQSKPRLVFDNPRSFAVGLGPVTDSDTLVFRVATTGTHYWRMRTFATCIGNEWIPFDTDLEGESASPVRSVAGRNTFAFAPAIEGARRHTTTVRARVEPQVSTRALVHLAEPRQLVTDQETIVRRIDGTFAILGSRIDFAPPPGPYELEAEVSEATPEELNKSSRSYPQAIKDRYLQEPNPTLLDALAQEAIGTARLPYDQAEAIRKFVASRCLYSLDAPPCPPGRNPAEWFLNESKVGYCDLYATATTLLCRAVGIPARIATGFNAGEIDPDNTGSYNLRERNRHAWCEVYFTDYGWVPFDATVLTVEATMAPPASAPRTTQRQRQLPLGPLVLAATGLLGLGGLALWELRRRRGTGLPHATTTVEQLSSRRLARLYKSALHELQRGGIPRSPAMTVGEHVALVAERLESSIGRPYEYLARLTERVLFAQTAPTESELTQAEEALRALRAALRERKR